MSDTQLNGLQYFSALRGHQPLIQFVPEDGTFRVPAYVYMHALRHWHLLYKNQIDLARTNMDYYHQLMGLASLPGADPDLASDLMSYTTRYQIWKKQLSISTRNYERIGFLQARNREFMDQFDDWFAPKVVLDMYLPRIVRASSGARVRMPPQRGTSQYSPEARKLVYVPYMTASAVNTSDAHFDQPDTQVS